MVVYYAPEYVITSRDMHRNVEFKAKVADLAAIRAGLVRRSLSPTKLEQRDTFFECVSGRLKLREEIGATELIYYTRDSTAIARESRYWRCPVADADATKAVLAAAYGIEGVVVKTRELYIIGQTRIHLDAVSGLGTFVEIEVVLSARQTIEEGRHIAETLMQELGIGREELVGPAYVDLLQAAA